MDQITVKALTKNEIDEINDAFRAIGWGDRKAKLEQYLLDQADGTRRVLVLRSEGEFAGYVTLLWDSSYARFRNRGIPEICDLNVLPHRRGRGFGRRLMSDCEAIARDRGCTEIGLGVGLISDYGNAQRLYPRLGYVPDGKGLHYKGQPVSFGENVVADDDLVIYMSKISGEF